MKRLKKELLDRLGTLRMSVILAAVTVLLTPASSRADESGSRLNHRQIAWRYAGADFPVEVVLLEHERWTGSDEDERLLARGRKLLYSDDGFPNPESVDLQKAMALARELLDLDERSEHASAEAYSQLAALVYRVEKASQALSYAARAVLLRPFNSRVHSNFAFYLQMSGRIAQSRKLYRRARKLDRNNTAVHLGLLFLEFEQSSSDLKAILDLVSDWRKREHDPGLAETASVLAEVVEALFELQRLGAYEEVDDESGDAALLDALRGALKEMLPEPITFPGAGYRTRTADELAKSAENPPLKPTRPEE